MAKLTLTDVATGYNLLSTINANNDAIEAAIENTLSRNGAGPNAMSAGLDMNSYRITNLVTAVNNSEPVTLGQAAGIAGVTNPITQNSVGDVLWPRSTLETANGITPTNTWYEPGNVFRYGAVADSALGAGGTDNTAAFQAAVDSGHPTYVPEGYYAIDGTVLILSGGSTQGGKTFIMTSNTRLERFGASAEPILHVCGTQNTVDGQGGILAARTAGGFTKGLLLFGNDPTETDYQSNTSVDSSHNLIQNFKIIGATAITGWDGSVGFYAEANFRFRGNWLSPHNATYYSHISNIYCSQLDYPFFIGTDSNASSYVGCTALFYGHAGFCVNGYLNTFHGCKTERPTDQDTTERFAWYFGKKNDPFTPETGCDKDAPTVTITGISADNPAVVTAVAHGEVTANLIKIESVVDTGAGTLEAVVNEGHFQITKLTDDTFSIPIDTSGVAAYSSGGVVRTDFYPITGARSNNVSSISEIQYDASDKKVRLVGFGIPVGAYDVADFKGTYGENIIVITDTSPGGIGKDGFTDEAAIGNNDVKTNANHVSRTNPIDFHGTVFSKLDDGTGHAFGTDSYKTFSGRMASMLESTVYDVLTIDNVGATAACVLLKLDFAGKESTNEDVHAGEMSWMLPITASTQRAAIKIKDFQADYGGDGWVVWSVAEAAGTDANTAKFTLRATTGNPTGTGDLFYTWKVDLLTSQLEGTNLDWLADVTITNGGL